MNPAELPLRDIHLPAAPGWWPPAPGWWLLLVGVLVAVAVGAWLWQRRRRRLRSAVYQAQVELQRLRGCLATSEPAALVQDLSVLLRRLAICLYPRGDAAGLTGSAWLQFLDRAAPGAGFGCDDSRVLLDAPYRRQLSRQELEPLFSLCERWIDAHRRRGGHA